MVRWLALIGRLVEQLGIDCDARVATIDQVLAELAAAGAATVDAQTSG